MRKNTVASLFPSSCYHLTDDWTNGLPADTIFKQPQTEEDRFIGIVDSKKFLHNPYNACTHSAGCEAEARYRKTLESQMGLDGGGLMLFETNEHAPNFTRPEVDGGGNQLLPPSYVSRGEIMTEPCEGPQPSMRNADLLTDAEEEPHDGFRTPPSTPVKNRVGGVGLRFPSHHRATSAISLLTPASTVQLESWDGCVTPLKVSKNCGMRNQESRSFGIEGGCRSSSPYSCTQGGDTHRTTPILNGAGVASLGYGSRGSEVINAVATSPHPGRNTMLHSAASPQLRTPVRNENHLLHTPTPGAHIGNATVSQSASPVSRRSVLYSQHVTPHRKLEKCYRVLAAEGLSLCDYQGRPNFSPLSLGYMGAIVALQQSVYLWQESGGTHLLYRTSTEFILVTAVSSSRRPTEEGDLYLAVGMSDGTIVVLKYHVGDGDSIVSNGVQSTPFGTIAGKRNQTFFKGSMSHVSTVHVVGHGLYSGCMDGTLTVRNLRDGSVVWYSCTEVERDLFSYTLFQADYSVAVGAPIYKLEVTPDGEHIAVGTTDSLFVYQTNSMGPGNRTRCRVVFSGASKPVRAFCWWALPFNSLNDYAAEAHHSPSSGSNFDFLHSILIYGGGRDGSVLSAYCVGSRSHKATYCLSAPILAIVSSETSEEIIVSVDIPGSEVGYVRHLEERGPAPATHGNANVNAYDVNGDRLENFNDWGFSDSSGEEEALPHVSYVAQHHPIAFSQQTHHRINGKCAGGIALGSASAQASRLLYGVEATETPLALPHMRPLHSESTEGGKLLQLFQLKDGGATLERLGGVVGLKVASLYMALSPDGSLLSTAGSELKLRIWRDFKARLPDRGAQCDFR
ncbi:hypothetical protein TraAM80_04850 [Trypanosoma rangeli]|uniref:Uncharacterized protein n=1 Tax=Trypanosoma rangeli TaxID=5698 RepID=A0A3R7MMD2_TRYRA|nr:uncharacterized protein TraAM80_04850 [Trypanosoma rangeli]RNF05120.1 hypothetical protein TraAM80_04850 [Trypanosoma rangeli]|eukprot:RNF05120.1 hypothetical protein TraAM80_04850 [Trypanosoma rangeli]